MCPYRMSNGTIMDTHIEQEVHNFDSLEALSQQAAEFVYRCACEKVEKNGRFSLVLSGGTTPRRLYETLARKPFAENMPWDRCHFFWSDERFVPFEHQESNFGMAYRAMLARVPVPEPNIHRMPTDSDSAEEAAVLYEDHLRKFFSSGPRPKVSSSGEGDFPRFDIVLLGVGPDGHTASLFPGSHALKERSRWVALAEAPKNYQTRMRLTLTLPVLNSADCVLFLVAGEGKTPVIGKIFGRPEPAEKKFPAARVRPDQGNLIWFVTRQDNLKNKRTGKEYLSCDFTIDRV